MFVILPLIGVTGFRLLLNVTASTPLVKIDAKSMRENNYCVTDI